MAKLAVLQTDCIVGDVGANTAHALDLLDGAAAAGADLAVLPECFSTGSGDLALAGDYAEAVPGPCSDALGGAAARHDMWIVAAVAEKVADGLSNTSLIFAPDGSLIAKYRKRFLYMGEAETFVRGERGLVVDMGFVTAGITICYDYMFPEYVRALVDNGARLLVHSTAWITTDLCEDWGYNARVNYRGQSVTRAIENGIFLMTANHGGSYDRDGIIRPVGGSCIIAPWGEILAEVDTGAGVAVAEVDFADIARWATAAAPYYEDYCKHPVPPIAKAGR
jgi:5-aminopentanamidase